MRAQPRFVVNLEQDRTGHIFLARHNEPMVTPRTYLIRDAKLFLTQDAAARALEIARHMNPYPEAKILAVYG